MEHADYQISTKLERLKNLVNSSTMAQPQVAAEVDDLLRDLVANGITGETIAGYIQP